jgi:hypothetical protein
MAPNGSRNPIRSDDIKAGILLVQQKNMAFWSHVFAAR